MNAGKWLTVGILALALAAGAAAWTHRYYRTDAVQAFWGQQTLGLIANAPETNALRWTENRPAERRRATEAKGMLNVRYMLGSDFAYVWPAEENITPAPRVWGLEFQRGANRFQIDFNADCTQISDPESGKSIQLVSPAAESLRSFFEERFDDSPAEPGSR